MVPYVFGHMVAYDYRPVFDDSIHDDSIHDSHYMACELWRLHPRTHSLCVVPQLNGVSCEWRVDGNGVRHSVLTEE